ncbi:transposase [Streptomyces sp. NPDC047718]|uniref:transposase n=1 Tax=Streptomyces sp. NPDC047718 TaxID=3155479 RepID=UPI0033F90FAA
MRRPIEPGQAFIEAQDWITAYHLPPYAPDLNPVEGIWSILRRTTQANTAFTDPNHLMRRLRHGLRQIQYRSDIIDGCLTGTGAHTDDTTTTSSVTALTALTVQSSKPGARSPEPTRFGVPANLHQSH